MRWIPWLLACLSACAAAEQVHVAVAANFAAPVKSLVARFEQHSGHRIILTAGSTGKLYAQIKNGAPFDVFLSADAQTPGRMEREGLAVSGQSYTYALGRLVLWSPKPGLVDPRGEVLRGQAFRRLSIANPRVAPYGAAAREVLEKLGAWDALQARLVLGENIAQAYQFVSSGNVELGFVAYSQIREPGKATGGSFWLVPQALYAPIRQDAALLARAKASDAARQFLEYLRSPPARELIQDHGYDLP